MNIENAKIFQISGADGAIHYGGNQDWFSSNTRAMGGCSSIAAANCLRALAMNDEKVKSSIMDNEKMPRALKNALCDIRPFKDSFEILMTGMYNCIHFYEIPILNRRYDSKDRSDKLYKKYIRPNMGTTNSGFIRGIIRFAGKFGINLEVKTLNTAFASKEKATDFIKKGLEKSGSVVMQTSYNKHSIELFPGNANLEKTLNCGSKCTMSCHFVTITDMDEDRLLITTWGKPATVSIDELAKSWHSIKAFESTLLYIRPADRNTSRRCYHTAVSAFLKGLIQSVIRHCI